ncbi:MAG TPA: M24 family metallopeptidase, partial [Terriglobales bacterium]|nr:M24 family metallopeptidase [Terriglobales bacterium]
IVSKEGEVAVLAPEDELRFAEHSWANRVRTFKPGSLDKITTPNLAVTDSLRQLVHDMGLHCSRIGYEYGAASEPATYAGMFLYSYSLVDALRVAAPSAPLAPAGELLARLSAVKTSAEVTSIRLSCEVAKQAFEGAASQVRAGSVESLVAAAYRSGFSVYGMNHPNVLRADGFAWCMSGPNSANAKAAFAHSSGRKLQEGDMVLVHANSYADGYWTDITRTQVLGEPDEKQRRIFNAIAEARWAAFAKIQPGAAAADVDRAAREVIHKHGFGEHFPHSTGHGIGFAAISANALPQVHPQSNEVLETGMAFNIEPAVYIDGYGGARHCDMVAVTERGMELLTDFQPIIP